jgi:hypothetical protein
VGDGAAAIAVSDGEDGAGDVAPATGGLELLEQEDEGEVVLFSGIEIGSKTPSMPWQRMEDPAVQIFGLMILTLLREKFLLPLLEILSMQSGSELGMMEPVGRRSKSSKSRGEGMEWRSKKAETEPGAMTFLESILSLGIKKVTLAWIVESREAMLMSVTKVK